MCGKQSERGVKSKVEFPPQCIKSSQVLGSFSKKSKDMDGLIDVWMEGGRQYFHTI